MTKAFLHIEGLTVLLACLYWYQWQDFSWVLFIVLLFTPDLAALGYLINAKVGAVLYNIVHTYTFSIAIVMIGILLQNELLLAIGLIFTAHIGLDRLCGFGLKYPTTFQDTHFTRLTRE